MHWFDFRFPWEGDEALESHASRHLAHLLTQVLTNQETIMATVAEITDALAQTNTDLQNLIAVGIGGVPEANLDPILAAVQQLDATITAAIPAPPQ